MAREPGRGPPELDADPSALRSLKPKAAPPGPAPSPDGGPDPLLHQPVRLRIMLHLYLRRMGEFNALQQELGLTPGNLQAHLTALQKAGYLDIKRALIELKPRTRYVITARGSAAVKAYAAYLEGVLADVARVVEGPGPP
jgi:DNA-binding MarR family transcriptional regulator